MVVPLPPTPPCAGYLTSCTVWSDTSGDGIQGASEPSAAITAGQFAFATGTAASGLGVLYIRTADEATKMVRELGWPEANLRQPGCLAGNARRLSPPADLHTTCLPCLPP